MIDEMGVQSYRDLTVWQLGMDLAAAVYELTDTFPAREKYGLASQLQRSAVSIPANIAEGRAKDSTKQYLFHVSVAMGSVAESETHLMLAERFGYVTREAVAGSLTLCDRIGRMLHNLRKTLKTKLEPP
jgi:four helix bundle protein